MERLLKLTDNSVIRDQGSIDSLLDQRRSAEENRKHTSPLVVLKDINLDQATLTAGIRKSMGTLEVNFEREKPFENELQEIPDLEIDLTPDDSDMRMPEKIRHYDLIAGSKRITIDVLFDETQEEYWKYFKDEKRLDALVRKNLLETLHSKKWKCDWTGAWSVAK